MARILPDTRDGRQDTRAPKAAATTGRYSLQGDTPCDGVRPGPGRAPGLPPAMARGFRQGGIKMRTRIVDEEVLARAAEAAEQERGSKIRQV
ncbi:MAG: hypothetical protein OQK27_03160, partial [Gammaproteobacteria bacterium]|nr:hypothetical protein [Gammaproteobacteria bacterium]